MIQAVIDARIKKGVTQEDLAQKIGTKQSVIQGSSLDELIHQLPFSKSYQALNSHLEIRFTSFK